MDTDFQFWNMEKTLEMDGMTVVNILSATELYS